MAVRSINSGKEDFIESEWLSLIHNEVDVTGEQCKFKLAWIYIVCLYSAVTMCWITVDIIR